MCTHPHSVYPADQGDVAAQRMWPRSKSELSWCIRLTVGLFVILALAALLRRTPYLGALLSGAAVVLQLWGPIARADRESWPTQNLGLNLQHWQRQLGTAAALALLLLPLWALALHVGPKFTPLGLRAALGWHAALSPGAPKTMATLEWTRAVLNQLLGVALPEEVFWRGYVQPVLEAQAGPRKWRRNIPYNGGTCAATALFAWGHVVGGAGILSLGTFFPGLVFAALTNHHRSVFASVLLHACCNLCAAWVLGQN